MTDRCTRFLVTSTDTALSRALVQALLREPSTARVIALSSVRDDAALALGSQVDPRLTLMAADLRHDRDLWRILFHQALEERIECVVHDPISAVAGHKPRLAWHKAMQETRRLLAHCARHPSIRRFVLRSSGELYRVAVDQPMVVDELHEFDLALPTARARSLVECDLYVCSQFVQTQLEVVVLRCAELLAADASSELFDYLCAPLCIRALGFDPIVNVLSQEDCARALLAAATGSASARGVFNIPGKDVLPLSLLIELAQRPSLALPSPWLRVLYGLRARTTHAHFQYGDHRRQFHHGSVLSGERAAQVLGFRPNHPIDFAQLAQVVKGAVRRPGQSVEPERLLERDVQVAFRTAHDPHMDAQAVAYQALR